MTRDIAHRLQPCIRAWLLLGALFFVLRGAVPFIAALAAHVHGVPLADVCPVYGVHPAGHVRVHAAAPQDPSSGSSASDHRQSSQTSDAGCALIPLLSGPACPLAGFDWQAQPSPQLQGPLAEAVRRHHPRDATLSWLAELVHPPPARG